MQPLLGLKYDIIGGDKLLTTEGYPDLISDGIQVDKSGGKPDGFQLGNLMVQNLASLTVQYPVLLILPN